MNQIILMGMARAFFADAYAQQAQECGQPLKGQVMDQLPAVIDPAAIHAARTLYMDIERTHEQPLMFLYHNHHGGLSIENWGHYAAMQSNGSGVGLFDYGIDLHIPSVEFGSHGLEKDYFEYIEVEE